MPSQIVFPCPNCGASQSVDDTTVSTQCQFCGNTIAVPENLRPKATPLDPALPSPQAYSFGGATGMAPMANMGPMAGMAGMASLPSMFRNMDLNKLREMAMAARSGNQAEAARLYGEAFGVGPDEAMQAAQLMAAHHPVVLSHMQFSAPVTQINSNAPNIPMASASPIYNLPSPPVVGGNSRVGRRLSTCLTFAFIMLITVSIGGAILIMALARVR